MSRQPNILFFAALVCSVTSCVSYHPSKIKEPEVTAWKGKTETTPVTLQEKWWTVFADPTLNDLEEEALRTSPSLQIALARLNQSKAIYMIARGDLFPQFDLAGSASRQRLPKSAISQANAANATQSGTNTINPTTPAEPTVPNTPLPPSAESAARKEATTTAQTASIKQHRTVMQIGPEVYYELDFWGKHSNATKAASEEIKGAEASLRTAQLLLTTQIATYYFDLRTIDKELVLLEKTLASYKEELSLNNARFTSGISAEFEPLQSDTDYLTAQNSYEALCNERTLAENLLAATLGRPASTFSFARNSFIAPEVSLAPGIPIATIKKRPDIQQAEHLVEQRRHEVGVAKTAFFPSIILSGFAGFQSNNAHSLLKWKNHVLQGTGSLFLPLFEGGKLTGELRRTKAVYEEAVAQFTDSVITACREVEDALSSLDTLHKRYSETKATVRNNTMQETLTRQKYEKGISDMRPLLVQSRATLYAQQNLVQIEHDRLVQTVQLVKSIGG